MTQPVACDRVAVHCGQRDIGGGVEAVEVVAAENAHVEVALDHALAGRRVGEGVQLCAVVDDGRALHLEEPSRRGRAKEAPQFRGAAEQTTKRGSRPLPGRSPVEEPPGQVLGQRQDSSPLGNVGRDGRHLPLGQRWPQA